MPFLKALFMVLALLATHDMKIVVTRASQALVLLLTQDHNGGGYGSGEVVGRREDGDLIVTCAHVAAAAQTIIAMEVVDGPKGRATRARVVAYDQVNDLALLQTVRSFGGPVLPVATKEPEAFDVVYIIANPNGTSGLRAVGVGLVSRTHVPMGKSSEQYQITGFAWPGSSGGMLVNTRGELVGIVRAVMVDNHVIIPDVFYAVPLPVLRTFLMKYAGIK